MLIYGAMLMSRIWWYLKKQNGVRLPFLFSIPVATIVTFPALGHRVYKILWHPTDFITRHMIAFKILNSNGHYELVQFKKTFSKLKITTTRLRNSFSKEILESHTLLSNKKELFDELDVEAIIYWQIRTIIERTQTIVFNIMNSMQYTFVLLNYLLMCNVCSTSKPF